MQEKLQWDQVYPGAVSTTARSITYRAKVQGGWLYRHQTMGMEDNRPFLAAESMVFIPENTVQGRAERSTETSSGSL